jgi:phosphoglucosamine mutase
MVRAMTHLSPSSRLFGTDGIRGPFGLFPLDRPTVTALGGALGRRLREASDHPEVVLGGDTRDSTPELCRWLARGLNEARVEVRYAGVLTTPGIAFLVRHLEADAGIAVSASHNPHPDNGIKVFDRRGAKLDPGDELRLEQALLADRFRYSGATGLEPDAGLVAAYRRFLAATLPGHRALEGLPVILDAAQGAASPLAGPVFADHGASPRVLFASPDGRNINRGCGSTRPDRLAAEVRATGGPLGVAFDGDADRAVLVDEDGRVRDGDAILYLWASALAAAGELDPPRVVVTTMSNLGLELALARRGIEVVRCDVGDREVVATLEREGILLGGEQSGHIVNRLLSTTGDGLVTALHLAHLVHTAGVPLSTLLADFHRLPQLLANVPVREKVPFAELPEVTTAARRVEERLGGEGRLLLRYSGTEPLARIMLEGPETGLLQELAGELEQAIRRTVGV